MPIITNEYVKAANSKSKYDSTKLKELVECAKDPLYFIENYVQIQHPIRGSIPFKPYPYQKRLINDFLNHKYVVALIARQMGKSTCVISYLLWKALFSPDMTILLTAHKLSQALELMQRLRYTYEELPEWLKAGVSVYNKGSIEFDNGSRIISSATTPDAGRGLSVSLLYCDEFAFVRPKIQEEFWTAIQPTLSTGGSCIITSTPVSDEDQFAMIWHEAENIIDETGKERPNGLGSNGFKAVKATWEEHPERDLEWANNQIQKLRLEKFEREFNCKFIHADETLIHSMKLAGLKGIDPIKIEDEIRWYHKIEKDKTYVVGLDPSIGTGSDYSAIQVYQLPELIQVAEWRSNSTPTRLQVAKLQKILKILYSVTESNENIYWTIENNTLGEAPISIIEEIGEEKFPGVFTHEPKHAGLVRRIRKGLNTTNKSKIISCNKFKSLVETNRIVLNSKSLVSEVKGFVRSGAGFQAKQGYNDDLISATLLCIRLVGIISKYEENLEDVLKEQFEDESDEPLPIIVG